jgi:two-component system, LuxR family, sensor kinase FixL
MSNHQTLFDANAESLGLALATVAEEFICLATSRGEPFYLNPAARQMVGFDDSRSIVNLRDFYDESSWAVLCGEAVTALNTTGRWIGRSRLRHFQTGEFIDVDTTLMRLKSSESGSSGALVFMHRRPNDSASLETSLAEARARKQAILESSLDPIITIDHKGFITEFNKAAEAAFGYPREKVLGTRPSDVLFPKSASAGAQNRIERYLGVGEGSLLGHRVEVTAGRADGTTFDAEMAMMISQEQGLPAMTFFIRDISRRKRAEEEQQRYATELERSNRELEQFAYVASHDLQEPLRKIRTFGDRLQLKCAEKLDGEENDCLLRMQNAAERMQTLIEGLLSLSRVTTQAQKFVSVDLAQIASDVVVDLESQIERVGGRVELEHLPTIHADPLQMRQLFQNLIGNALKFHRVEVPPVVKVEGRFLHGRKDRNFAVTSADERCKITVEDNGIGFEEKYGDRIFGVFQRLHPRDVFEGTGIGLALCKKIVERHGGTIVAHSKPGVGSRFEIVLPAVH